MFLDKGQAEGFLLRARTDAGAEEGEVRGAAQDVAGRPAKNTGRLTAGRRRRKRKEKEVKNMNLECIKSILVKPDHLRNFDKSPNISNNLHCGFQQFPFLVQFSQQKLHLTADKSVDKKETESPTNK
jgi:hypothetical protein